MYKLVVAKKVLTSEGIWNDVFNFLYGTIKAVEVGRQQDLLLCDLVYSGMDHEVNNFAL